MADGDVLTMVSGHQAFATPAIPALDAVLAESSGEDVADALVGAASPDAGNVFATMADIPGTPTLAEVLAEGISTGGAYPTVVSPDTAGYSNTDPASASGSSFLLAPAALANGVIGGSAAIQGGEALRDEGVNQIYTGGFVSAEAGGAWDIDYEDGAQGASITLGPGVWANIYSHGRVSINTNGSRGSSGDVLASDGNTYATWQPIRSLVQASDVGSGATGDVIIAALRAAGLMAATPDALAFDDQPTGELVGATITPAVTVQVLDDLGDVCIFDNTTAVTVALTVPGGATLGGTLTQTAVAGIATFDDLSVDTAGVGYTLTASSGGLTTDESSAFTITAP